MTSMEQPVTTLGLPTTPELRHDLDQIDAVIAALHRVMMGQDDADDLAWLQGRRRCILEALAWRRAQKGKKLVDLTLWRCGGIPLEEAIARVA